MADRRLAQQAEVDGRMRELESRIADADERLRHLYRLVEGGEVAMDDLLTTRISELRAGRETAVAALHRIREPARLPLALDESRIAAFGRLMRERLTVGEVPFRKAYLAPSSIASRSTPRSSGLWDARTSWSAPW